MWSGISDTDFFHSVLLELYKLVNTGVGGNIGSIYNIDSVQDNYDEENNNDEENDHYNDKITSTQIKDYQHCELLNYLTFLSNLVRPSSFTNLTINLSKLYNINNIRNLQYKIEFTI